MVSEWGEPGYRPVEDGSDRMLGGTPRVSPQVKWTLGTLGVVALVVVVGSAAGVEWNWASALAEWLRGLTG